MDFGGTVRSGESRHPEWDLMYRKGLTPRRIAELCGAVGETVARHIRVQKANHPDIASEHRLNRPRGNPRPLSSSWESNVGALSRIRLTEGKYPSTSDADAERRRLGTWLSVQRRAHRAGRLAANKVDALRILPGWENDQRRDFERRRWHARVAELQAFKTEHAGWPRFRGSEDETERVLGVWLHAQRQGFGRGELTDSQVRLLDTEVPGWNAWRIKRLATLKGTRDMRASGRMP